MVKHPAGHDEYSEWSLEVQHLVTAYTADGHSKYSTRSSENTAFVNDASCKTQVHFE
jgi:hypothetical protein